MTDRNPIDMRQECLANLKESYLTDLFHIYVTTRLANLQTAGRGFVEFFAEMKNNAALIAPSDNAVLRFRRFVVADDPVKKFLPIRCR